ncbi:MAG: glycerol-3-phosphate dehydrogenase [Azospirillaceae bacterium]|nr:glycerol-3-phosphate dehydrogenase [Azospirillaceae bacterium]
MTTASGDERIYDIAVIGGGINGTGIARDAAGRGWKVYLCERRDLGSGTSCASTKLIHGGLRYLEYYEFRLVREALMEREVLWGIAPHIIRPLRFVLPHHRDLRPAWLLRLGLLMYDHLGGRKRLPGTRTLRLRTDPRGAPLKPIFTRGFEYSDCWVEDSRLVVLNARDAADRGATIAPRTACTAATRRDGLWHVEVRDENTGSVTTVRARALVNAAGPWVGKVAGSVIDSRTPTTVRLVQGSHIVVPRLYDGPWCYIFQGGDGRIVFTIPYEHDFTLIGTTDQDFSGDLDHVRILPAEIDYLCRAASTYLQAAVTPDKVVWTYSGVRPLYDDGSSAPQQATRDYVLKLDAPAQQAPLLSIFGGKITTYRRLAEAALLQLSPHLDAVAGQPPGWTGKAPLPGGDFTIDGFDDLHRMTGARYPFLAPATLLRLLHAYGTRVTDLLGAARSLDDLGPVLGADLTLAELRYLVRSEWAQTAEDVVWRRSKLGLRLSPAQITAVDQAIRELGSQQPAAA